MVFLILDLVKLKTKNKACNIFALKCLGYVEFNKVMIMAHKPIAKRVWFGIMP